MIYENVLNRLKKINSKKTELSKKIDLSVADDIQKWNDFNGLDTNNLNEIRNVQTTEANIKSLLSELEAELETYTLAFGTIVQPIGEYESTREEARNLKIQFESMANDLGVNPASNESYQIIEEGIEMYDVLIDINRDINENYNDISISLSNLNNII